MVAFRKCLLLFCDRIGLTGQVLSRFGNEFMAASMNHYHIRWANSKVDWQAFQTKDEAVAEAERLKHPEENYKIEEHDGNCDRCLRLIPNARIAE